MITIRKARLCDARLIASIGRTSWLEAYSVYLPKRFMAAESVESLATYVRERMYRHGTKIYIATYKGTPCGVAILMRKHVGYLELDWLFILPGYRNYGIGHQLIELCKREARSSHLRLTLSALRKNTPC